MTSSPLPITTTTNVHLLVLPRVFPRVQKLSLQSRRLHKTQWELVNTACPSDDTRWITWNHVRFHNQSHMNLTSTPLRRLRPSLTDNLERLWRNCWPIKTLGRGSSEALCEKCKGSRWLGKSIRNLLHLLFRGETSKTTIHPSLLMSHPRKNKKRKAILGMSMVVCKRSVFRCVQKPRVSEKVIFKVFSEKCL